MIHVGMDLHRRDAYVRALTDDGELIDGRRVYLSDLGRLWEYLDQFDRSERKRVVLEAVDQSRWMYRQLSRRPDVTASVVTPHAVRIIVDSVFKTDQIDAYRLAWLSSVHMLPEAWMPDERCERLRELIRHRAAMVQVRTRCKNSVSGVLSRCGVQKPHDDIFGVCGRRWLAALELPRTMRLQVDDWLAELDGVADRITSVENRIRRQLREDAQWKADAELLETIPGVALITIATVLAELGDYRRFRKRAQIAAYAGLVPKSRRSAGSAKYGHLTKRGPSELRRVLTQVAAGVARKVPRYQGPYERIRREKCGNVAKSAIARRLLEDAWVMLMKREPFRLTSEQAESLTRVG